jgi:hypothetical protein
MGEPRGAVTYKEVERVVGKEGALEVWRKICEATGAGVIPIRENRQAAIDLGGASDAKRAQVENLLAKNEPEDTKTVKGKQEAK